MFTPCDDRQGNDVLDTTKGEYFRALKDILMHTSKVWIASGTERHLLLMPELRLARAAGRDLDQGGKCTTAIFNAISYSWIQNLPARNGIKHGSFAIPALVQIATGDPTSRFYGGGNFTCDMT